MNGEYSAYKKSKLFYKKTGHGTSVLLAFHGFGQNHRAFDLLADSLKERYTIYTFDLYFHGQSEWGYGEQPLARTFWKDAIYTFLVENKIDRFSLIGFSLGCRFTMATAEDFINQLDGLFLFAPDGVRPSFWYSISTYPIILRKAFKSMICHPARFKIIVNTLQEARLMNKGLLKFAEHQMNTEAKRKKVYYTWVVFRHLKVNLTHFINLLNEKKIPVTVAVGKNDKVITAASLKGFVKKLNTSQFAILNSGHAGLLKDVELSLLFGVNGSTISVLQNK